MTRLQWKTSAVPIVLDARNATFTDTLLLRDVVGLKVLGGRYGSATGKTTYGIAAVSYNGSNISFDRPVMIGNNAGEGMKFLNGRNISVTNGSFTNLGVGVSFVGITNGTMRNNKSLGSAADGFRVVDSHTVDVGRNTCGGTVPAPGAHPDCIQLWSIAGNPVQSDIDVNYNVANGAMQGFTSFDPARGGGLRITFRNNIANLSFPQGIACYACVDSVIINNRLTTLPGSIHFTRITVLGGSNNTVANNYVGPPWVPPGGNASLAALSDFGYELPVEYIDPAEFLMPAEFATGAPGGGELARGLVLADVAAAGAIPEPETWGLMIAGFGLVGAALRRRSLRIAAA